MYVHNATEVLEWMSCILGRNGDSTASFTASRRILRHFGSLNAMAEASVEEIRKAGSVSARQAKSLYGAIRLGQQAFVAPYMPGERFSNSGELFQRYRARFLPLNREHFFSLHLNSKNRLIREVIVSIGSLNMSVVHPREVFSAAVRDSAAALIFIHNHPSGDPEPSSEDSECTRRLVDSGRILGIRVLDHIVIGRDGYYSFSDAGRLEGV